MDYRPTVLNISSGIFVIVAVSYTIINNDTFSAQGGWGTVYMIVVTGIGLFAFITDIVLQRLIKDNKTLQLIALFVAIGVAILLLIGL